MYSVAPAEIVDPLIYDGFVDELVELLEIKDNEIMVPNIIHNMCSYISSTLLVYSNKVLSGINHHEKILTTP